MFCRYCGAELPKKEQVCTACGKDNSPKVIVKNSRKKLTPKQVKAIIISVLAIAILIPAVIFGIKGIKHLTKPNDIFYKDNYCITATDMVAEQNKVIATSGEHTLTNGQLQVFYWLRVYEIADSGYSSYYGLDYRKPLNEQIYDSTTGKTWQQMCLEQALTDWTNYIALTDHAKANDYKLPADYQEAIDGLQEMLEEKAEEAKVADVDAYLSTFVCHGCTFEEYQYYYTLYLTSRAYYDHLMEIAEVTDAELETYFSENATALKSSYNITKDSGNLASVRHILINIEGGTRDENGKTVYSDEDWENCRKKAQEIYDKWLAGDRTEDSFSALAMEKSQDSGSQAHGGLYTGINENTSFVLPFLNWTLDKTRKTGDTDLVKTIHGYHIMYFVNSEPGWILYSRAGVQDEKVTAQLKELSEAVAPVINYKEISMVYVSLV